MNVSTTPSKPNPRRGRFQRMSAGAAAVALLGLGLGVGVARPAVATAPPSCDNFDSLNWPGGGTTGLMGCEAPAAGTYTVIVTGAGGGGAGGSSTSTGGHGAVVTHTVTVTAGQILDLEVGSGGQGGTSGPDGGGGGGWSAIKNGLTILVLAGGGGGAGSRASSSTYPSGSSVAGGDAGAVGTEGQPTPAVNLTGDIAGGGGGASASAGGSGGASNAQAGTPGASGVGGNAGGACSFGGATGGNAWQGGNAGSAGCGATGGGGGAGYFGGGGGGAVYGSAEFGGGGGGGSSYPGMAAVTLAGNGGAAATSGGNGRILFSALPPAPAPEPGGGGSSAPVTVTIGLSPNGGVGSVPAVSGGSGTWSTVPSGAGLSRDGYVFAGWNTSADGSGTTFAAGAAIQLSGDNTLYAQWSLTGGTAVPDSGAGSTAAITGDLAPDTASVPAGGLPAGGSSLTVAGQPVPVTVTPNRASNGTSLVVSGDGWRMTLAGRGDDADPLGLTPKSALILQSEKVTRSVAGKQQVMVQPVAESTGSGFKAVSEVRFYLLAETYLGSLPTDASGAYAGKVPVPAGIVPGTYTLQANGFAPNGAVRSLNIGVVVKAAASMTRSVGTVVYFDVLSSDLSAQAKVALTKVAEEAGTSSSKVVSVGYVQPTTTTANDKALSKSRARAVANFLRGLGVKGTYVVRGDGKAKDSGAKARRVQVTVT